jgi:UDP-GlcNAc:undecaprenyl-phosphate/decaprenyl-phosphate GlcNAc-1-phosphate transferase
MSLLALLLVAAAAGAGASFVARALSVRLALVSAPDPLVTAHRDPVPYLGGVGVAAGALLALAVLNRLPGVGTAVITTGFLFLAIGVLDDFSPLPAGPKLLFQAGCAAVPASLGLGLPVTGSVAVDGFAGFVWILVVVNAVNLTDVCDGLVAGLAAIAFVGFALVDAGSRSLALAAAGACLGFLLLNGPHASIFLGDAGSHVLGFWLAVPPLAPLGTGPTRTEVVASVLILGVPLFELAFVVVARVRKGVPWWRASADHFALRLQSAGLSRWNTDAIAWTAGGILALAGVTLIRVDVFVGALLSVAVLLALAGAWHRLLRWEPHT